jgi:hypothetical protein
VLAADLDSTPDFERLRLLDLPEPIQHAVADRVTSNPPFPAGSVERMMGLEPTAFSMASGSWVRPVVAAVAVGMRDSGDSCTVPCPSYWARFQGIQVGLGTRTELVPQTGAVVPPSRPVIFAASRPDVRASGGFVVVELFAPCR